MKLKLSKFEGEINKDDYDFLQRISSSDLIGLIGGDWIKFWRWNNLLKIAGKFREKCESLDLDPKTVSPKFLSQFFEESSLEDDETLQEMWSNLLINRCIDQGTNSYYISILKNLEPQEAELVNLLFSQCKNDVSTSFSFDLVLKSNKDGITKNQLAVMIQKLYSFNILRPPIQDGIKMGQFPAALETIEVFRFTEMGIDFCKKCNDVEI